jgi:hypothetical protein
MKKDERQKYKKWRFDLKECEAHINLVEKQDDKGYATAYLNVLLPDGRWVVFSIDANHRIPLFKEAEGKYADGEIQ